MIDSIMIISLIEAVDKEAKNFTSKFYHGKEERMKDTKKILSLLRNEIEKNPDQINKRVLRSVHDLGMSAYRQFENSDLEERIYDLTKYLYNNLPFYRDLEPLRMDFGKGEPI